MTDKHPNASHSQKLLKYTTKIKCFIQQKYNVLQENIEMFEEILTVIVI